MRQHAEQALELFEQRGVPDDLTVSRLNSDYRQPKSDRIGDNGPLAAILSDRRFCIRFSKMSLCSKLARSQRRTGGAKRRSGVVFSAGTCASRALHSMDYTARRVVENRELLAQVPAAKVPSRLIMTLADNNVGALPQSALQILRTLAVPGKHDKSDRPECAAIQVSRAKDADETLASRADSRLVAAGGRYCAASG